MTLADDVPRARGGVLARRPLTSFFVLAYALAWLIEVPMVLSAAGMLPPLPRVALAIGIVVSTFAPMAAAFIMAGVLEGRAGVVRMLRRLVLWRVGLGWYAFVLLGIPIIVLLGTIVVPGALAAYQPIIGTLLVAYPLAFLTTLLLGGPLGEEPGWRGFALPRLQERNGPLRGSLVLGILWSFWHFPLFFTGIWTPPTIANIVMFTVMITALTVIMTWVFNHGRGSLLLMILMHASFNTFVNRIAVPLFPAPIFEEYGLLPVLIGFTATALVLVVATRGRLGYDAYLRRAGS